ncbi:MAG: hypothetical protein K5739_03875 [Lachnospiraceae bacterium]|nr:hypothetical protein [Lachnospiraceae bacterium]
MDKKTGLEGSIIGGLCWHRLTKERMQAPLAIENYGYKVYSQNDEDGILQELFRRIGTRSKEFIELGVENGLECNTHFLLHYGWHGLWLEASADSCGQIRQKFRPVISDGRLKVKKAFVTAENIEDLIAENRNAEEKDIPPDLLSIDVDGNDWYIWEAVKSIQPRLVCIEYNGKFPPDLVWKQAYNAKHRWDKTDWQGASLKALELLGREKGYVLVGTNLNGANAFFVRKDLWSEERFLPFDTAEKLYNPYRGKLKFEAPGHAARYCLVGQKENLGVLNYFDNEKEYKKARQKEKRSRLKRMLKKRLLKDY